MLKGKFMNKIECPHCKEIFQIDKSGYSHILQQVHTQEFKSEVAEAVTKEIANIESQHNTQIQRLEDKVKNTSELAVSKEKRKHDGIIYDKDETINNLKNEIKGYETNKKVEINEAAIPLNNKIKELESQITQSKLSFELDLNKKLQDKKDIYDVENKQLQEEITKLESALDAEKNFKARLSTKMIGESLEQHCESEFNKIRTAAFPTSSFEKDNDINSGSKGDYIFRHFDNSKTETVSIMFEMKNESEKTSTKKKNKDFFKKLDIDRKDKNCEYAVLVSMLESDNEFYNAGIADVSYAYEKMYVIRPQFFIPMITLLTNVAQNALKYKKELALAQKQHIDITKFETDINECRRIFGDHYTNAKKQFESAIKGIDVAIANLEKTKKALETSGSHFGNANKKIANLTIKQLTNNNPTMTAKFQELEIEQT
jgi:hypothetical protein